MYKVYLSGPMYVSRDEATSWRNEVKAMLEDEFPSCYVFDPCNRWFVDRDQKDRNSEFIVEKDKYEIRESDCIIVHAEKPGWGTPMEVFMAHQLGKLVIAIDSRKSPSIWIKEHSDYIVPTTLSAVATLLNHVGRKDDDCSFDPRIR